MSPSKIRLANFSSGRIALPRVFFNRSAVQVARDLIGCFLCTPKGKFKIAETEAYEGVEDLASHAAKRKTKRNEVMFGKAGYWYVYFTYGMHYMLNIVCGSEGHPGAVLIRGAVSPTKKLLGPAILTKALKINKKFNGLPALKKTGLWIKSERRPESKILKTPRIGVAYSGPIWSQKKYRFVLKGFETKKFK